MPGEPVRKAVNFITLGFELCKKLARNILRSAEHSMGVDNRLRVARGTRSEEDLRGRICRKRGRSVVEFRTAFPEIFKIRQINPAIGFFIS
jgi:hypothetical protein